MFIKSLNQLDNVIKNNLKNDYFKNYYSITELSKKYGLDRNVVIAVIGDGIKKDDLAVADIKNENFIVISDTHFGSSLDKMKYLDAVYEYASKYNIKTILHAGDLMQSTLSPVKREYVDIKKQAEYIVGRYPYDKNITNYILFGNHDFHALNKNFDYVKIIRSRNDFKTLGYKLAYLKWCNELLFLSHHIEHYKINIHTVAPFIGFIGHRHSLCVKEPNIIYVPSLSLDTKRNPNGLSLPGFLVVENDFGTVNVYHYVFREYIYDLHDNVEILLAQNKEVSCDNLGIVLSRKLSHNDKK